VYRRAPPANNFGLGHGSETRNSCTWRAPVRRLDLFRLLLQVRPEGMPAGAIAERLGGQPSLPSFHLTQLGHADLNT